MQVEINMHRAAIALHDRAVDAAVKAERERVLALCPTMLPEATHAVITGQRSGKSYDVYTRVWRKRIESGEKP